MPHFIAQIQLESAVESLIDKLGLPAALLFAAGIAAWKVGKWWAPVLKDWGERFIGSHEKLVDTAIEIGQSNAKTLIGQAEAMKGLTEAMKNTEATIEELRKTQLEMHAQNLRTQSNSSNSAAS